MRDVEIRLTQGIHSWVLGTEEATPEGAVVWRVQLPPDVRPGPARLTAATAQLRVTVG